MTTRGLWGSIFAGLVALPACSGSGPDSGSGGSAGTASTNGGTSAAGASAGGASASTTGGNRPTGGVTSNGGSSSSAAGSNASGGVTPAGGTTGGAVGSGGKVDGGGGATAGSSAEGGTGGSNGGAPAATGKPVEKALPELAQILQEHSVAALNGEGYVIGGYAANQVTDQVQAYDPSTDSWRQVAKFPAPMNHGNAGTVNGKIYVAGFYITGMSGATTQTFAYDAKADSWTEVEPMPSGTERAASCVAVDGNYLYVVGGAHQGMSRDTVTRYDAATDSWETLPKFPERREHCAAGAIGGIIYVAGGRVDGITGVEPKTYAYDPTAKSWSEKASIDPARGGVAGAVLAGRLLIFGGEGNDDAASGVFPQIDAYDPVTDSWELVATMSVPRHGYGAAVIDDKVYLLGGATRQGGGAANESSVFYFE